LKLGVTGGEEGSMTKPPTLQELQTQQMEMQTFPQQMSPQPQIFGMKQENVQVPQIPEPSMQFQQTYYSNGDYNTEELVESIVQERMGELDGKLTEFRTKYNNLERKMADLHNQLSTISKSKSQSDHAIISKLDSYGDTLINMNAKISSLEKAFKEALPALIESVRALTDLVGRLKREA